ncbi:MAG: glycosyltransferase [Magnetococcus sp. DMHC-8]
MVDDKGSPFLDTILRLDAQGDVAGLLQYVNTRPFEINELLAVTYHLLTRARLLFAFVLAMLMDRNGQQHWVISLALGFGGLLFNRPDTEATGLARLAAQVDALSRKQQSQIHRLIVNPVLQQLIKADKQRSLSTDELLRLLEICKAVIPRFRTAFDWQAPVPVLSLDGLRQRGRDQAHLFAYPLPEAGLPRKKRHVIIFMKDFYIAHRLATAMERYGWGVALHATPTWSIDAEADGRTVLALCRQHETDLVVLYLNQVASGQPALHDLLERLRQERPALKLVAVSCDSWSVREGLLDEEPDTPFAPSFRRLIDLLDGVWVSDSPSLSTWNTPLFAGKVLHVHLPHACAPAPTVAPLADRMLFIGTKMDYLSWFRPFWLLAAERLGLPIEQQAHLFPYDLGVVPTGTDSLDCYARHMQWIQDATCCLHFTMKHQDLRCIVTHRSFEALLSGALLVQERAPDMHRFFIPGEHYLEFASLAELSAIARFMTERREEAEEIRRCGSAFAREHYSDDKLLGYLEKFLWP